MTADYKPLVVIFKNDTVNLLHRLQRMLQYKIRILYIPGLQLFTADYL